MAKAASVNSKAKRIGKATGKHSLKAPLKTQTASGFWKGEWNAFTQSWKLGEWKYLAIYGIDLVFYSLCYVAFMLYGRYFEQKIAQYNPYALNSIQAGAPPSPEALAALKEITVQYTVLTILLAIIIIGLFAAAKLSIYRMNAGKGHSLSGYWRFLLLIVMWLAATLIITGFFSSILDDTAGIPMFGGVLGVKGVILLISMLSLLYMNAASMVWFCQKDKPKALESWAMGWKAMGKVHRLAICFLVGGIMLFLLNLLSFPLSYWLPNIPYLMVIVLVVLAAVTWFRNYFILCANMHLQKERIDK